MSETCGAGCCCLHDAATEFQVHTLRSLLQKSPMKEPYKKASQKSSTKEPYRRILSNDVPALFHTFGSRILDVRNTQTPKCIRIQRDKEKAHTQGAESDAYTRMCTHMCRERGNQSACARWREKKSETKYLILALAHTSAQGEGRDHTKDIARKIHIQTRMGTLSISDAEKRKPVCIDSSECVRVRARARGCTLVGRKNEGSKHPWHSVS